MMAADTIIALQQEALRLKRERLAEVMALVEACGGEITIDPEHIINQRGMTLQRRTNIDGSVTYKTGRERR